MSTNRKLRALAAELPFYPKCDSNGKAMLINQVMSGQEIINKKLDVNLKSGGEISATAKYTVSVFQPADHFTNMKRAYKQKGEQGVIDYCKMVYDFDTKQKQKQESVSENNNSN